MKQYGFGVDIGGTTCKIGFFDMSGIVLEKWEIKTNTENGGASILHHRRQSGSRLSRSRRRDWAYQNAF